MQRTVLAIAAAAATAAAAAIVVVAFGAFLYLGLMELGLRAFAAALCVAVIAAMAIVIASALAERSPKRATELVAEANPTFETPEPALGLVGGIVTDLVRHRPLLAVGLSVGAAVLAARQPGLMRELSSLLGGQNRA